jgi:hypothetical protein
MHKVGFAACKFNISSAAAAELMLNLHNKLHMVEMFGRIYKKVWPFSP